MLRVFLALLLFLFFLFGEYHDDNFFEYPKNFYINLLLL